MWSGLRLSGFFLICVFGYLFVAFVAIMRHVYIEVRTVGTAVWAYGSGLILLLCVVGVVRGHWVTSSLAMVLPSVVVLLLRP
ncbi:hypothetical protein [Poriferisphaera sp. WC338]|uniref:hypothetical protein n=1 Tax=Poriferisphaera sp. WC338 TaxID=3425129 RepID=UPI003D816188